MLWISGSHDCIAELFLAAEEFGDLVIDQDIDEESSSSLCVHSSNVEQLRYEALRPFCGRTVALSGAVLLQEPLHDFALQLECVLSLLFDLFRRDFADRQRELD